MQLHSRAWAFGKFAFSCEIHHNILMHFSSFLPGSIARANHIRSVIAFFVYIQVFMTVSAAVRRCLSKYSPNQHLPASVSHSLPDLFQHLLSSPPTSLPFVFILIKQTSFVLYILLAHICLHLVPDIVLYSLLPPTYLPLEANRLHLRGQF